MKILKVILLGTLIWVLGVSFYTVSFFIPMMDDLQLQANLVLAIALIPNAWLGARIYYKNGAGWHGGKVGVIVVVIAILLDATITVPYFIIPEGGSYTNFFGASAFWLIAIEYFLIVFAYWNFKVKHQII